MATYRITFSDSLSASAPEKVVWARADSVANAKVKFFQWYVVQSGDVDKTVLRVQIEQEPDPVIL